MNTEIIDFKTPSKLFALEVRGFAVLTFTLIELAVYNFRPNQERLAKMQQFVLW